MSDATGNGQKGSRKEWTAENSKVRETGNKDSSAEEREKEGKKKIPGMRALTGIYAHRHIRRGAISRKRLQEGQRGGVSSYTHLPYLLAHPSASLTTQRNAT